MVCEEYAHRYRLHPISAWQIQNVQDKWQRDEGETTDCVNNGDVLAGHTIYEIEAMNIYLMSAT